MAKKEITVKRFFAGTDVEITDDMIPSLLDQIIELHNESMAIIGYERVEETNAAV